MQRANICTVAAADGCASGFIGAREREAVAAEPHRFVWEVEEWVGGEQMHGDSGN